jgi:hypothetical protein
MSGGQQQPMGAYSPYANKGFMPKDSNESYAAPPGDPSAPAPGTAPGTPPSGPQGPVGSGNWFAWQNRAATPGVPIWTPNGYFASTPFLQTYGGQKAPYADLSAQILDSFRMTENGAGRFGNNMAARFGFQGGTPQWRADHNLNGVPIQPYGYQPQAPLTPPQPPGAAPGAGQGQPPIPGKGPGGLPQQVDHMANFKQLYNENPALAYQYTNQAPSAQTWFFQNQNKIQNDMFGGDQNQYNQWINGSSYGYGPGGGNNPSLASDPAAVARLRAMAGGR